MVSDGRVDLGLDNGHGVKGSLELVDDFLGGLEPGIVGRDVPGHDSEGDIGDGEDIVEHACDQLGRHITVVVASGRSSMGDVCRRVCVPAAAEGLVTQCLGSGRVLAIDVPAEI